jgi:2-methylcitrate dehydratase PrpD
MIEHSLTPDSVAKIDVRVTPYAYHMVGVPFRIGDNPRVDAQFSIQYCVANALLRKESLLRHFDESYIREPRIMDLVRRIHVTADQLSRKAGLSLRRLDVIHMRYTHIHTHPAVFQNAIE